MIRKIATCPYCSPERDSVLFINGSRFRFGSDGTNTRHRACGHLVYAEVAGCFDKEDGSIECGPWDFGAAWKWHFLLPALRALERNHLAVSGLLGDGGTLNETIRGAQYQTIHESDYVDGRRFFTIRIIYAETASEFVDALVADINTPTPHVSTAMERQKKRAESNGHTKKKPH